MNWKGVNVGYALTGSHCTLEEVMPQIQRFVDAGANVIPIISHSVATTDTRFGKAEDWKKTLKQITGNEIISTIVEAEPLERVEGPTDAGHDAVPPSLGESAGEELEDRASVGGARPERRFEHGQLVVVGEQGGRGGCRHG